jgi:nicotinamidase-related amidase
MGEEVVAEKRRSSAFIGTNLDLVLRSNGIVSVAVVGVVTEGCVESTARHASFHDDHVLYVGDCTASTNQEIHGATLKIAAHQGYDVILPETVVDIWTKNPRSKPHFA